MKVRNILFSIAVTAVLAAAGAADAGAQQKRALVIGIGDYPAGSGWREINGDRDVELIVPMLRSNGFAQENIFTLVNEEATKSAIEAAFRDLTSATEDRDELYIHFSGHGQQVTDISGDEPDGLDEALIPYDAAIEYGRNGYKGQNHILDDELGMWLEALRESVGPKGVIVVALDACHSGDATRGEEDEQEHVRGTSEIFGMPGAARFDGGHIAAPADGRKARKADVDWVCLSACKSYQSNYEYKSESGYYGRLSWAVSKVLKPGVEFEAFIGGVEELYDLMPLPGPPQDLDVDAPANYNGMLF